MNNQGITIRKVVVGATLFCLAIPLAQAQAEGDVPQTRSRKLISASSTFTQGYQWMPSSPAIG